VVGVTWKRIVPGPPFILQIREDVTTSDRFCVRSKSDYCLADSLLMVTEKTVPRAVRLLPGKLIQPLMKFFPALSKEALRLIAVRFE